MSKQNNILGVESIEIGDPGDGVMGTTLTPFTEIEVGSTGLEGSTASETTLSTENSDSYITLDGDTTPTTLSFRLYGLTAEERVMLMGGEVGADATPDAGNWLAPNTKPTIFQSVKLNGKTIDGKRGVIKVPFGKISARDQGTITKNGLPAVAVTVTVNTPQSAAGVKGAPYVIGWETVV